MGTTTKIDYFGKSEFSIKLPDNTNPGYILYKNGKPIAGTRSIEAFNAAFRFLTNPEL